MNRRSADRIRVTFYELQQDFEVVARELHRMLDLDPRFPNDSVYTVKHRLKNDSRLIEKIDQANTTRPVRKINHTNFQNHIEDLLGMRIVCLRLSDLDKLKDYLESLRNEDRLTFVKGPVEKKTFLVHPGDAEKPGKSKRTQDIQYSGYSSIHYVVKLGKAVHPGSSLLKLKVELQLRTILEEAWGEIDHKYRYEITRIGKPVPTHIESGFRDFGLYLQAAARQAEHLCEEAESLAHAAVPKKPRKKSSASKRRTKAKNKGAKSTKIIPTTLEGVLKARIGFVPTGPTLKYCERRMLEHATINQIEFEPSDLYEAMSPDLIERFKKIFEATVRSPPFTSSNSYQVGSEVIALVNFAIFSAVESDATAEAGLTSLLRRKF